MGGRLSGGLGGGVWGEVEGPFRNMMESMTGPNCQCCWNPFQDNPVTTFLQQRADICLPSQWAGGLALGQDHELDLFLELDSSPLL